jgi:hypothetical protein
VRLWRRRNPGDGGDGEVSTALVVSPRVERALIMIAVHAQQLDDRMGRIERRIDDLVDDAGSAPTHEDLLEVRTHSAKVAGELTRLSVALRAEIEEATRREPSPEQERMLHFAEQVRHLSDRLEDEVRRSA